MIGNEPADEPGGNENRLHLNPNDTRWPAVLEWADDQTYTFKSVKVRQVSPGEFEVLSATTQGTTENPTEFGPAARDAEEKGRNGNYPNPAVAGLM